MEDMLMARISHHGVLELGHIKGLFVIEIQEAIANARQVCGEKGATSGECAAAWDEVEELQASAAHQRQVKVESAYESYVDDGAAAAYRLPVPPIPAGVTLRPAGREVHAREPQLCLELCPVRCRTCAVKPGAV